MTTHCRYSTGKTALTDVDTFVECEQNLFSTLLARISTEMMSKNTNFINHQLKNGWAFPLKTQHADITLKPLTAAGDEASSSNGTH
jgi:hypothetical protein